MRPKIIVFASGTARSGGSGFENLAAHSRDAKRGELDADIVAVASNHERGGVWERARRLGVPFIYFPAPWTADAYARVVRESGADWVALSGWLKYVCGLDPQYTFNIHPALLSLDNGRFGGLGMYGHRVHEAVAEALAHGEAKESGFSMHFVTDDDDYDCGPVFFEHRIPLVSGMDAGAVGAAVNKAEHLLQPRITNLVVNGQIRWDGKDPKSLVVPPELLKAA